MKVIPVRTVLLVWMEHLDMSASVHLVSLASTVRVVSALRSVTFQNYTLNKFIRLEKSSTFNTTNMETNLAISATSTAVLRMAANGS